MPSHTFFVPGVWKARRICWLMFWHSTESVSAQDRVSRAKVKVLNCYCHQQNLVNWFFLSESYRLLFPPVYRPSKNLFEKHNFFAAQYLIANCNFFLLHEEEEKLCSLFITFTKYLLEIHQFTNRTLSTYQTRQVGVNLDWIKTTKAR